MIEDKQLQCQEDDKTSLVVLENVEMSEAASSSVRWTP